MLKSTFCLLILFTFLLSRAQDTTLTFYFKSGQSKLTSSQNSVMNKLQQKLIDKMSFEGYADTVGKAAFNKRLSYKRAQAAASSAKTENKIILGKGEVKQKVPLNSMRKVIVKVWYAPPVVPVEPEKEPVKITVAKDPCTGDTTLTFASGTKITLNTCYYKTIKHCFSYKEYLNAADLQRSGLRTVDEKGEPIVSGGMFDIRFCSDSCLKKPVIVYLPVPTCMKKQAMTLWRITRNNQWRDSRNKIEIVKIGGKDFYKIEVLCPGGINCDKKTGPKRKLKVKLKNGLRIKSATLSYNCPVYSMNGTIKRSKKRAIFPYVCPQDEPVLYLKAYNKKGDTLLIDNKHINDYTRKRKILSTCFCNSKPKEKFLGIFKVRQKYLYRKYKIFRKDF